MRGFYFKKILSSYLKVERTQVDMGNVSPLYRHQQIQDFRDFRGRAVLNMDSVSTLMIIHSRYRAKILEYLLYLLTCTIADQKVFGLVDISRYTLQYGTL